MMRWHQTIRAKISHIDHNHIFEGFGRGLPANIKFSIAMFAGYNIRWALEK
jgi:hypothetical protein